MAQPVVVDLRNIYRPEDMAAHGFIYESVGRRVRAAGCDASCSSPTSRHGRACPSTSTSALCIASRCRVSTWIAPRMRPGEVTSRIEILPRSFDTPLPIDAVLDDLARTLASHNAAVLVAPPGAGKTTRVPLALLDAPWAARQEDHHAGAAADRGARQRRAHGEDAGRTRRRDRRLSRPLRLENVARDPDRGRHRRHFLAADSRRSRTDRRRRRAVRRISRALARCRSRAWRWRATRRPACARICASW